MNLRRFVFPFLPTLGFSYHWNPFAPEATRSKNGANVNEKPKSWGLNFWLTPGEKKNLRSIFKTADAYGIEISLAYSVDDIYFKLYVSDLL